MSIEVHRLIGRAFADKNLRDQLLANPSAILGNFDLTKGERQMLMTGLGELNKSNGYFKSINSLEIPINSGW